MGNPVRPPVIHAPLAAMTSRMKPPILAVDVYD